MSNSEKLVQAFAGALKIAPGAVVDTLGFNTIKQWDSVAHMHLVAELEDAFGVMLDTDEIIDMSSVAKAKEILANHDVVFD